MGNDSSRSLREQCEAFFRAARFKVSQVAPNVIRARRTDLAGKIDDRVVLVHEDVHVAEGSYVRQLEKAFELYPDAEFTFLAPNREGLSKDFLSKLRRMRVKLKVRAHFFDLPFIKETDKETATEIEKMRNQIMEEIGKQPYRVPQPYSIIACSGSNTDISRRCDDLLETMKKGLYTVSDGKAIIWFVIGQAGGGKSVLCRQLFVELHEHFMENRLRMKVRRPVVFLPQHVRSAMGLTFEAVLEAFVREELETRVDIDLLEWLLVNGYMTWLLDGLDEVIGWDAENFFEKLKDFLTTPKDVSRTAGIRAPGAPCVVIFLRDSLYESVREYFQEFISDVGDTAEVVLFRLEPWERQQWLTFLQAKEATQDERRRFNILVSSDAMKRLAGVPFYMVQILWEKIKEGTLTGSESEEVLLSDFVTRMLERDREKGIWQQTAISREELLEVLGAVAFDMSCEQGFGLPSDKIKGWFEYTVEDESAASRLLTLSVFSASTVTGNLTFIHEIVLHYFLGKYMEQCVDRALTQNSDEDRSRVLSDIGRIPIWRFAGLPSELILCEAFRGPEAFKMLISLLSNRIILPNRLFKALLYIYGKLCPDFKELRATPDLLRGRDLSELRFFKCDMNGFNLDECDLTKTVFEHCVLANAKFHDAKLAETNFKQCNLVGADFGSLARATSVILNGRFIGRRDMPDELSKVTKAETKEETWYCDATLEVHEIFRKFVSTDGRLRRWRLNEPGMMRGKKYLPDRRAVIEQLCRAGFFHKEIYDRYVLNREKREVVANFVTNWQLSDDLREVIDTVCEEDFCPHIKTIRRGK